MGRLGEMGLPSNDGLLQGFSIYSTLIMIECNVSSVAPDPSSVPSNHAYCSDLLLILLIKQIQLRMAIIASA
jgi:hypothetical protein